MAENNGIELAKAYIPIIPSMEGIKGKLEKELAAEAGEVGTTAGKDLGSKMLKALGGVVSTAAVGKLLSAAFSEGAGLEQSMGGVETLFKDSADEIKEYAADAYRTAGLSANEYMETATSFSASLIKSLQGDTEAAAKATQTAITDMSDNVNKFGSDAQSLQNAYQGFARDNFTMLDNLKLGYAGNKQGMESLLADAEKLSGIHYDISSYADMIEAIHVIQENLGVTGTTAKEASKTFSGSMAAMKSSAKNLAGALTTGGDVNGAVKALEDTTLTFGRNALRMMDNLMDGLGLLGDAIEVTAGSAAAYMATVTASKLPSILSDLKTKGEGLLKALDFSSAAPEIAVLAAGVMILKGVIDDTTDAINEIPDPFAGMTDEEMQLVTATKDLTQEIINAGKARSDALSQIESESDNTKALVDEIYKLNSVEKLDAQSKATLAALVSELNEQYPDLSLSIDETTGHIKDMQDAVQGVADVEAELRKQRKDELDHSLAEVVTEQAKANEKAAEALKKYTDAQERRDAVQAKLEDAQKRYNELFEIGGEATKAQIEEYETLLHDTIPTLTAELEDANGAVGATANAYVAAKEALNGLNDEYNTYSTQLAEINAAEQQIADKNAILADAMEALGDYTAEAAHGTYQLSQETLDRMTEISNAYGEAVRAQEDTIRKSLDLFSEFSGGAETSAEELLSNLAGNKQGLEDWAAGIEELSGRIDQGLLDSLTAMGTASASKVKALNDMTPAQLEEYNKTWRETQELITKTAEQQNSKLLEQSREAIADLVGIPKDNEDAMADAMELLAGAGTDAYFRKFNGDVAQLAPVTGEDIIKYIADGVNSGKYDYQLNEAVRNKVQYALERSLEMDFGPMIDSYISDRTRQQAVNETANAVADAATAGMRGMNSTLSSAMPNTSGEGAQVAPVQQNITLVATDGRVLASWIVDNVSELQAQQMDRLGRGY